MRLHGALFVAAVLVSRGALAMSSTDRIAWPGKPVVAQPGWPKGVLELVNDPLRADGWLPWFSECPNDVTFYEFNVKTTNDVNRLVVKLVAINAPLTKVLLYPAEEPRALAFTTRLKEGNNTAAVFSIGDQQRLNQWYEHLREAEPGVRAFGVHRYKEPPKAQPPTLALYVGNTAIDLASLIIPPTVDVSAVVSDADRAEGKRAALIKAIDDFVARHRAKPRPSPKQ